MAVAQLLVVRHTMPSDRSILLGLLRFGALPVPEKVRALSEYQVRSDSAGGGPHVWNPSVEVIESLWRTSNTFAYESSHDGVFTVEDRERLGKISKLAWSLLDYQPALVDHSAFQMPLAQELASLCTEAVSRLESADVEYLPFWDLMCYTCD